jgi:hypothetical protein
VQNAAEVMPHKRLANAIASFLGNSRGNFALYFAIVSVPLLGIAGVAVDYSLTVRDRNEVQETLDAAVLAGIMATGTDDERIAEAKRYFRALVEDDFERISGLNFAFSQGGNRLDGSAKVRSSRMLSRVVGAKRDRIEVNAAAMRTGESGWRCLHALNMTQSDALIFNNKRGPLQFTGPAMVAPECVAQANSASTSAVEVKNLDPYQFAQHCIVGRATGDVAALLPPPDPNCRTPLPDPLAGRAFPAPTGSCMPGNFSASGGVVTIQPGYYCAGMRASATSIVLRPGVYHVSGGDVSLSASASISGNGVTIIMQPGAGAIEIESVAVLDLKAPASGPTAGFIVIDRSGAHEEHVFKTSKNDVAFMALDGIMYAPEDHFELHWKRAGVGANERPLYFRNFGLIADTIDLHGYNQVYISTPDPNLIAPELMTAGTGAGKVRLVR